MFLFVELITIMRFLLFKKSVKLRQDQSKSATLKNKTLKMKWFAPQGPALKYKYLETRERAGGKVFEDSVANSFTSLVTDTH